MTTEFENGIRGGVGSQWELERLLVDPTLGFVLAAVGGASAAFLALAWLLEVVFGINWPLVPVALFVTVTLIQSPPDELASSGTTRRRIPFQVAVWTARTVLLIALFATASFAVGSGSIRWGIASGAVLLFLPLLWFPLHQLRQFALLTLVGGLRSEHLWPVGFVTLSQAALITGASWCWASERIGIAVRGGGSLLAAAWLVGGNAVLASRSRLWMPEGKSV